MLFNNKKFELLRYGPDQDIKESTFYLSANDEIIEEKEKMRDLGIIVNNEANFNDHIDHVCAKVRQKSGWILRTFSCRQPYFMKLLWKQLVQPHIDYCSQLMPLTGNNTSKLENLQRNYLRKIPNYKNNDYWQRLQISQMLPKKED